MRSSMDTANGRERALKWLFSTAGEMSFMMSFRLAELLVDDLAGRTVHNLPPVVREVDVRSRLKCPLKGLEAAYEVPPPWLRVELVSGEQEVTLHACFLSE